MPPKTKKHPPAYLKPVRIGFNAFVPQKNYQIWKVYYKYPGHKAAATVFVEIHKNFKMVPEAVNNFQLMLNDLFYETTGIDVQSLTHDFPPPEIVQISLHNDSTVKIVRTLALVERA